MERRHLVIAACALMLASACNLLIDSDDALVERDADAATADGSGRDAADAEVDVAPDGNPCGGSAALVYRGVMRMPGDRCGCTGTLVCAGPDALLCANDVGNNACGGCGALPGVPSGACGACGGGTWECDGGELTCVGALQLNLCGGCALLEGPPGAACDGPEGSRWECSAGDRVICELPSRNLCGAFGDLTYEGLDATPGEACEADCGAGRLICDPDARALFCDGPEANGCGSCGPLAGPLGEGCGCGGGGTWTCNDGEAECVGGDSNACGGCAPLAVAPGQRCPDGGLRICASRDATACATFGEGTNFCGGIIELDDLPGTACGTCDSGTFACQGPNEVACEGDRAGAALNACGGCEPLIGVAGGGCGTCGRGTLRCSGTDEFVCTGDPGASALNACGGCAGLDGVPGTPCGTCAAWRCIGGGVQCLKDPGGTNCGGSRVTCEELECGAENRGCTEATLTADAECGACLDGYEERAGTCEPVAGDTLPEVTTVSVDPATITQTSVRLRGALTSLGSPNASQHGFCRGSGRDPALGGDGVACSTLGPPTTTGPFEEVVSALAPASTFHARAYATNAAGTAYGEDVEVTTLPAPPPAPSGVAATIDREGEVRVTWDPVAGATGYLVRVDDGVGVGASSPFDDTAAAPGAIASCTPAASTNTLADRVSLACSDAAVADGPSRRYQVIAVGPGGRSEPSVVATGRRAGGTLVYSWERSVDDTVSAFASWVGAPTGDSGDDTSAPFNTLRHYRVVLSAGAGVVPVTTASASGRRGVSPTVETLAATGVSSGSATLAGAITSLGGAATASAAGFCWRIDDESSACAGTSAAAPCAAGWTNTAASAVTSPFEATVTLAPGSAYATCAYAVNGVGVGHGDITRFASGAAAPSTPTGVSATSSRSADVRVTWTAVPGATSYELEIGGSGTWIPVVAPPYDDTTAPAPSLTACLASASDGTSGTEVVLNCTGDTTIAGVARSYRVRALGPGGTSGASTSASGNRVAGARSYQWQRSAADSDAAYSDIGGPLASAPSSDTMTGITRPAGRRYRAVVSAAGATSVTSSADRGYIAGLPGILTQVVDTAGVTDTQVELSGSVSSLNGAPELVDHGFCVGPTSSPAPGGPGVTCSSLGRRSVGGFSETVTGLTPETTYHVRAFGTNVAGTSFGTSRSFTTLARTPLGLGSPCTANADCESDSCSLDAAAVENWRCVPVELPSAGGGAMEFRYVPETPAAGFTQGSPLSESDRGTDEAQWQSTIYRAYLMSRTEVTQGQWTAATGGTNSSCFQSTSGTACSTSNANSSGPVENVNWSSAAAYANWLSEQAGLPRCYTFVPANWDRTVINWGRGSGSPTSVAWSDGQGCTGYRLPTESEWEWAARGPVAAGSSTSPYFWGSVLDFRYLWFTGNSGGRTHAVGGLLPNAYGLRDVSGNVWEWVWDLYGAYPSGAAADYTGASSGSDRVFRGGSQTDAAAFSRTARRGAVSAGYRNADIGFRLVRTLPGAVLPLGALCTADAECGSGACSVDAADAANRRCVPVELPSAGGGAMEFGYVPATAPGGFTQGSPTTEPFHRADETQWQSILTRATFVSRTEVTQGQWKVATGGTNPAYFQNPTCVDQACASNENANDDAPVERVTWWSVAAYTNWLSDQAGLERCYTFAPEDWDRTVSNWSGGGGAAVSVAWTGGYGCTGYRLLSESEWEFAARGPVAAGTATSAYFWGDSLDLAYAWTLSGLLTHAVGTKLPNAYGLYDVSGNVWEWVWDWSDTYPTGPVTDYAGPASATNRIRRGGSWYNDGADPLRSAHRISSFLPGRPDNDLGFRIARSVPATNLSLGAACVASAECASGSCSVDTSDGTNRRCVAP